MFHVTEEGRTNLCGGVGSFRGEKMPLREVGPPERSHRDLRRPSAQSRPSVAPPKKAKPSHINPIYRPPLPQKPPEHPLGPYFAQNLDRCVPVGGVGIRGHANAAKRSHTRSLPTRCRHKQSAGSHGTPERTLAVNRPVACRPLRLDRYFEVCVFRMSNTVSHSLLRLIGLKPYLSRISNQHITIHNVQLRHFVILVIRIYETGTTQKCQGNPKQKRKPTNKVNLHYSTRTAPTAYSPR